MTRRTALALLATLACGAAPHVAGAPVAGQGAPVAPPAALPAAASPATASAPAAPSAPVVRVFEIRYADLSEIRLVLPTLLSDSQVLTVDGRTRTVTVVDHPEFVARVEQWLKQFDVPPHEVLVRIIVQKAQKSEHPVRSDVPAEAWTYEPVAETTLHVRERGTTTQAIGPDGVLEIHVRLGSVDAENGLMHFDEVALHRREEAASGAPVSRKVFSTSVDARNRVAKTLMATRDEAADEALVLRLLALIREQEPGG